MTLFQAPSLGKKLSAKYFEADYWQQNPNSIALDGGRGGSQKISIAGKAYVLRQYLRGGLMAKLSYDKYLYLGYQSTRPFLEYQVLNYASKHGLPVSICAAYYVEKKGVLYRAAIITEFIENQGTLASYLNTHPLSTLEWSELARVIRLMHALMINHADLNADNILLHKSISDEMSFSIIDFDKARIETHTKQWPLKNINRLKRSLDKLQPQYFTEDSWQVFLAVYQSD